MEEEKSGKKGEKKGRNKAGKAVSAIIHDQEKMVIRVPSSPNVFTRVRVCVEKFSTSSP